MPLALVSYGCGTSCPEIVKHREDFSHNLREHGTVTRGADMRLSFPWAVLDSLLAEAVAREATQVELVPPALGGALEVSARLVGARAHMPRTTTTAIGLTLELALERKGTQILVLELETGLTPELVRDAKGPGIRLALGPDALGEVKPRTTPEGRAMLSRWLERELPPSIRMLGSREVVDALADELMGWAGNEVWPLIRKALPDDEPLFSTTVNLPELERIGARALTSTAEANGLVFGITTGVPAPPLGPTRFGGKRMSLSMAGKTATALISMAMDRGDVPGRFSGDGEPDKDGPWEARVGWLGGSRPLLLHLWRTRGGCQRVEVGAQLALRVEGDELAVDVREGKLLTLAGPPFAEAFAWLETLFGRALAFSFRTASLLKIDAHSGHTLRLVKAHIDDAVTLELEFSR